MVEYNKVNVKFSDAQMKKLKDAVKDNTGTTLRIILIYHMNYYSRQDKKRQEMLLIIIRQLI